MSTVKRYIILLFSLCLLTLSSCGKMPPTDYHIVGEWEVTKMDTVVKSITIGSVHVDVFIQFKEDGYFVIYQKVGNGRFRKYSGTWSRNGSLLMGQYNDSTPWASNYTISTEMGENTLVLTSGSKSDAERMYLSRTLIPESVIINAIAE